MKKLSKLATTTLKLQKVTNPARRKPNADHTAFYQVIQFIFLDLNSPPILVPIYLYLRSGSA